MFGALSPQETPDNLGPFDQALGAAKDCINAVCQLTELIQAFDPNAFGPKGLPEGEISWSQFFQVWGRSVLESLRQAVSNADRFILPMSHSLNAAAGESAITVIAPENSPSATRSLNRASAHETALALVDYLLCQTWASIDATGFHTASELREPLSQFASDKLATHLAAACNKLKHILPVFDSVELTNACEREAARASLGTKAGSGQVGATPPDSVVSNARPSPDFRCLHWFGKVYSFTAKQAACVELLWEGWETGTPDVDQKRLLKKAGSASTRVSDLFKRHPAWKTLIVSVKKGSYRLASD